jgi:transaldolase
MDQNAVSRLNAFGQSPWLDYVSRDLVRSGELERLIERWGLRGLTSNPSIFEQDFAHSEVYDQDIRKAASAGASTAEIYESLVLDDIRRAADAFLSVYRTTDRRDGYVSLEASPHLVDDTAGTVAEARRLWTALDRPNVMIKVPGTSAGLAAITELIGSGINVNVTLLFSLRRYEEVTDAFLTGLERAAAAGLDPAGIASVASFFLSRIDTMVDDELERVVAEGGDGAEAAMRLRGRAAIACARCAYAGYRRVTGAERCRALLARGARMQRLLWASTSTKNPDYDATKYVQSLIGPETVSTMPRVTLEAFEGAGAPAETLTEDRAAAQDVLKELSDLGIEIESVADRLLVEGIRKFAQSFDASYRAIEALCTE